MRSNRAMYDVIAVSAYQKESALNAFQDVDLSLLVDMSTVINREPRREDNANELNGKEEPDYIYDLGATSTLSLNFPKAQPQHFGFLYAYALGQVTSETAGSGFLKTITPVEADLELNRSNPTFTAAQRLGKTVVKQRFASFVVDSVTSSFKSDSFLEVKGECKGTGLYESSITEETISSTQDSTTLTLATNAVAGSTAQERLDNVHRIVAELSTGEWTEVEFTVVSDATPAEITIIAPGTLTDTCDYKVLYAPAEVAWMTFPPREQETPLRITQMTFNIGGKWDGTDFNGGRSLSSEIKSIEYQLNNNFQVEFVPGGTDGYANSAFRDGRTQTLKLNQEFRNYMVQNYIDTNETFGVHIKAEGAEYETGHNYTVEFIFPKVAVLKAALSVDGKRLAEAGDMQVLEDDTYGSVIVKVKNLALNYAA